MMSPSSVRLSRASPAAAAETRRGAGGEVLITAGALPVTGAGCTASPGESEQPTTITPAPSNPTTSRMGVTAA